jgi:hypothetical protein
LSPYDSGQEQNGIKKKYPTGSRRLFGTVIEKKCVFLVDTSGSMMPYIDEVKKELASLIWDQLYKFKVK